MAKLPAWKAPYPRTRYEATFVRPVVNPGNVLTNFGSKPGTYVTTPGGARDLAYEGQSRVCHDIVTPGFAGIISSGGIINNPFTSVTCKSSQGGSGQRVQYTGPLSPWPAGKTNTNDVAATLRTYDARYLFGDVIHSDGEVDVMALLSEIDVQRLLVAAKTSAMSKVDQNLASGLVGMGELRQTVTSLINPLSSIRQLIQRMKKGRKAQRGVIKDPTSAIVNEYLAFYYGLLPFCRDIESFIDAYVKSGAQRARQTARGGASDKIENLTTIPWSPVVGVSTYSHRFLHRVEVEVRSGLLHELPPLTWQKVYGVRFSDFFDAAYQLTPWSFFVDYFSNLGKLVNALTPRPGVTYLASWSTIVATITDRAECTGGGIGGTWTWTRGNTEWAERVVKARVRNPEATYANIGFTFKTGDWSSKAKVMAVISLILQQLTK